MGGVNSTKNNGGVTFAKSIGGVNSAKKNRFLSYPIPC
jgi:hypothetical protein